MKGSPKVGKAFWGIELRSYLHPGGRPKGGTGSRIPRNICWKGFNLKCRQVTYGQEEEEGAGNKRGGGRKKFEGSVPSALQKYSYYWEDTTSLRRGEIQLGQTPSQKPQKKD